MRHRRGRGRRGQTAGAGGGDCGIALLDPDRSDLARLRARWAGSGVRALPLRVPETGGHPA
ncbi:hypothetical protein ACFQV2_20370 [Actinokineospora soli]|uniref:Uncharacterized protein n=1 Tax=Actinokineospora soli TaxID=1048753 RepID=A0ABW2TRS7_9PSEU